MRRTTTRGSALLTLLLAASQAQAASGRTAISPNGSIPGTEQFARVAGGVMTVGLIAASLGLLVSLAGIGLAGHTHNVHLRDRFKTGAGLSLIGTIGFGAANRMLDWAYSIGTGF